MQLSKYEGFEVILEWKVLKNEKMSVMVVLTGILIVTIFVVAGCSKGHEGEKAADDPSAMLKVDRYPLVNGG